MEREEKLGIIFLLILFIFISAYILSYPYDPQQDIVDGIAIDDWGNLLLEGKWQIPLDEWMERGFRGHQSGLVQRDDGTIYVVPEKGIGFIALYAFFLLIGLQQFLGVFILGIALLSTYYLSRTIVGTRAAVITGVFLLTSALAIMMTYRYAWVDMGTMALLAAGFAIFLYSQRLPERAIKHGRPWFAVALGITAGVVFCWAVSTRYVMGVTLVAPLLYLAVEEGRNIFSLKGFWRGLKRALPFLAGTFAVLLPLMYFNTVAYGGPFMSGYDVYRLSDFFHAYQGPLANATVGEDPIASWNFIILSDTPNTIWQTAVQFAAGMPCFFFAWFGIWRLRREKPALALIAGWFLAVYCTYLTVGHLGDMGLRALQESRYFLPMLGAMVVLAGAALHFPKWKELRHWALVFTLLALLLPLGLFFATENMTKFGPQQQQFQSDPPPPMDLYELFDNPVKYHEKIVYVVDMVIFRETNSGYVAEASVSTGTGTPPRILLICHNCIQPPGLAAGLPVEAMGIFRWDDKDRDGEYDHAEGSMQAVELVTPGVEPQWPLPNLRPQQQPPGGNQGGQNPPQNPPPTTPVSTLVLSQLYASPQDNSNEIVHVTDLVVDRIVQSGIVSKSTVDGPQAIYILMVWTDSTTPENLQPGTELEVIGVFRWNDRDYDGVFDPQEDRLEVIEIL